MPWYWTDNPDHFDDMLYRYNIKRDVKAIYCHTDLTCWPGPRIASIHGKPVYAGHIHYIVEDNIANFMKAIYSVESRNYLLINYRLND